LTIKFTQRETLRSRFQVNRHAFSAHRTLPLARCVHQQNQGTSYSALQLPNAIQLSNIVHGRTICRRRLGSV
jgi:hypothetical protein